MYDIIHIIHLYAVFIYGGFLFVDNLFLSKIQQTLSADETAKEKSYPMHFLRQWVAVCIW